MALFCITVWSVLVILMGTRFLEETSGSSSHLSNSFKANITCRSINRRNKVNCTWPTVEDYQNCSLFFRLTAMDPTIPSCQTSFRNWTECLAPSEDNECIFPGSTSLPNRKTITYCSKTMDVKLNCQDGWTEPAESAILHIHHDDTIIPNLPKAVILQNIGEKSMNITWKLPKGWPENDKGFLTFRVHYWQQWLPDGRIDFPPFEFDKMKDATLSTVIRDLKFANVETCFKVGVRYDHHGPNNSRWSCADILCKQTEMEKPAKAPKILSLTSLEMPGQAIRKVNITWKEIPVEFQGAPIRYYHVIVRDEQTGIVARRNVSGNQTYYILDFLRGNTSYSIKVAAVNLIGTSDFESMSLRADPAADFKYKWHIHAWVIVLIVIILLVVFSAVFGCWRNMKRAAQNMRGVEIRPPVDIIINRKSTQEQEAFDLPGKKTEPNNNSSIKPTEADDRSVEVDPLLLTSNSMVGVTVKEGGYIQVHMPNGHQMNKSPVTNYLEEWNAGK